MSIDPEKFTQKAAEALNNANTNARSAGNNTITPERVLICMLDQFESVVLPTLKKIGVEPNVLRHQCEAKVKTEVVLAVQLMNLQSIWNYIGFLKLLIMNEQ